MYGVRCSRTSRLFLFIKPLQMNLFCNSFHHQRWNRHSAYILYRLSHKIIIFGKRLHMYHIHIGYITRFFIVDIRTARHQCTCHTLCVTYLCTEITVFARQPVRLCFRYFGHSVVGVANVYTVMLMYLSVCRYRH